MSVEVPLFTRCCFCAPLRCGILVWAYIKLVFNILVLQLSLMILSTFGGFLFFYDYVFYIFAMVFSAFSLLFFDIIINFVLIVGCHKKHATLLRFYYRFGIAYAALFLALSIVTNASLMCGAQMPDNGIPDLSLLTVILSTICSVMLILHIYLVLLVRSEIFNLEPSSQIQFVNHIADPKCFMHVDLISNDKNKEYPEKNLS